MNYLLSFFSVSVLVFVSVFGESTLFAHAPHYPFVPAHLPLYGLLALLVALLATLFLGVLHRVKRWSARLPLPLWARPGLGGLVVQATSQHDLPLIQGVAVYFTVAVIVVNLLVDLTYSWLDPRVRVS